MPPPAMVGTAPAAWLASADFAALRDDLAARIVQQGTDPQALLRRPYAQLRACLPDSEARSSSTEVSHVPAL
jgi:hypothetical protein